MASSCLHARSLLVLLVALAVGPATARAGDKFESWRTQMLQQVNKVWPDMATADEIVDIKVGVALALDVTRDLERAAGDDGISAAERKLVEESGRELERLRDALVAFGPTYVEVAELTGAMSSAVGEAAEALEKVVRDVAGKREEIVRSGFRVLQRATNEQEARHLQATRALRSRLDGGFPGWRAQVALFSPVERALDARARRLATTLQDTWDRVYDHEKAVQAAQDGDGGALFDLCLRGRLDEALQMLTTWRPPRLVFATIAGFFDLPSESGWIDILAHGSANSMTLELADGRKLRVDAKTLFLVVKHVLGAEDLARWQSLNDDEGVGFRLLSCSTGSSPAGIAQGLANELGVPVKAPDDTLWILRTGGRVVPIIHMCDVCKGFWKPGAKDWVYDHVVNSKQRGTWKTFKPSNGDADAHVRAWLYEMAKEKPWWQLAVTRVNLPSGKSVEDVMAALAELNPKLKKGTAGAKKAREAIEKERGFVALDGQTRDGALKRIQELSRLGLTARVEVMTEFKDNFKGVKAD